MRFPARKSNSGCRISSRRLSYFQKKIQDMEAEQIKNCIRMAKAIENDIAQYRSYDTAAAFLRTQKKIKAMHRRQLAVTCVHRLAAVSLIPLLAATATLAYLYLKQTHTPEESVYSALSSAPGTVARVSLPDRSDVWLNAGSTLRYPSRFSGKERNVYLEGEAYFQVESDVRNPFYVNLNRGMRIKAYGTRFDVCSYPEDSLIEVVLESGAVEVAAGKRRLHLRPDEMMSFDAGSRQIAFRKVRTDEKTAWKNGRLLFRNTPLQEVVKKLARRYNVDIELQGDTSKVHHFRATFTTETITQALDYMKMAAPLEWRFAAARQQEDFSYTRQQIIITLK
jgi:ferric-dicitrate binding protein FerR (iron transport regulator)